MNKPRRIKLHRMIVLLFLLGFIMIGCSTADKEQSPPTAILEPIGDGINHVIIDKPKEEAAVPDSAASEQPRAEEETDTEAPATSTREPAAAHPAQETDAAPSNSPPPSMSKEQQVVKAAMDRNFEAKIKELKMECTAMSSDLLNKMIGELDKNEEATLMTLQAKFLGQLLKAEASCDASFQKILDMAAAEYQDEGIPVSKLPDWKTQYNKEKSAIRSSAIAKLINTMK